jgi:hypothetical protein
MKKIIITGKNNIDCFKSKQDKIKLKSLNQEYGFDVQRCVISNIYNDVSSNEILYNFTIREIENKIKSYKNQDIKKNIFNDNLIITYKEVIDKLFSSALKCFYCCENIKIIYRISRDNKQWTLDRINNDLCHSNSNTIICCLQCNIKRKLIDKDKFEFTKKLKIIKKN